MKDTTSLIRGVLAEHTGRERSAVRPRHRLEEDLDLSPLEVVLIAQEVEEALDVDLCDEDVESVETVGDLFTVVTRALAEQHRHHALPRVA